MADEFIRLDTTIMGIDGLINEAPTGSQARALLCAKDMIYDQQRYTADVQPVKHGKDVIKVLQQVCDTCGVTKYCVRCKMYNDDTGVCVFEEMPYLWDFEKLEEVLKEGDD